MVQVTKISDHYDVRVGHEVTTTEYGHYFPRNIKIGNIKSVEKSKNGKYWDIDVELATNMSQLGEVYIIRNSFKKELNELEEGYRDDN